MRGEKTYIDRRSGQVSQEGGVDNETQKALFYSLCSGHDVCKYLFIYYLTYGSYISTGSSTYTPIEYELTLKELLVVN